MEQRLDDVPENKKEVLNLKESKCQKSKSNISNELKDVISTMGL